MTQTSHCKIEFCRDGLSMVVHTSFNIQDNKSLQIIIEHINGVEPMITFGFSRYSFMVTIGQMFNRNEIAKIIEEKINEFAA